MAVALTGDAIAANMMMVGIAWQKGMIPLSRAAIERAIELNGVSVDLNRKAFAWGRMAAHDLDTVTRAAGIAAAPEGAALAAMPSATSAAFIGEGKLSHGVDETVAIRGKFLTEYQDAAYAKQYTDFVERVRTMLIPDLDA